MLSLKNTAGTTRGVGEQLGIWQPQAQEEPPTPLDPSQVYLNSLQMKNQSLARRTRRILATLVMAIGNNEGL